MYPGRESRPCLLSDHELFWPLRFLLYRKAFLVLALIVKIALKRFYTASVRSGRQTSATKVI